MAPTRHKLMSFSSAMRRTPWPPRGPRNKRKQSCLCIYPMRPMIFLGYFNLTRNMQIKHMPSSKLRSSIHFVSWHHHSMLRTLCAVEDTLLESPYIYVIAEGQLIRTLLPDLPEAQVVLHIVRGLRSNLLQEVVTKGY